MLWISIASLVLLSYWVLNIFFKYKHQPIVVVAMPMKILAGLCLGFLYKYYLGGGDTFQYFYEAKTIAQFLLDEPNKWFQLYFKTTEVKELAGQIVYYDQPRALLFAKVISLFYLLTGGNYWIISAFLSLISFVCIHRLVQELNRFFPAKNSVFAIAFFYLPSFVFWTSGLLKEGLAFASLAILVEITLKWIRTGDFLNWRHYVAALVSMVVLWQFKYYYAAVAMPVLGSLLVFSIINKKKKTHPIALIVIFAFGILLTSMLHYNLSLTRVMEVVYENHQLAIQKPGLSNIQYHGLDGSLPGFVVNMPLALFSGLFRPMFFEVENVLQAVVMVENLLVLAALVFGLLKSKYRSSFQNPYVLATLVYVFSLAILLAFASPNLGTLSRYKVAYWPFFVALVLLLNKQFVKRPGNITG